MMSKWPDGFDVRTDPRPLGWAVIVEDNRIGRRPEAVYMPGYTTRQEAELAALDWIQRRIGVPETVPQPVLAEHRDYKFAKEYIEDLLERLVDLEHMLPTPAQADYADEREHIAAADCWIYRCGLIGALRNSLQAERDLIQGEAVSTDWELRTERHGAGNWHVVIGDGRKWWRLSGFLTKSQALAAGSAEIRRRKINQETTCRENE